MRRLKDSRGQPSLDSYHHHPLFQGLGTLAESVPLEGSSPFQGLWGRTHGAFAHHYTNVVVATSFVDNQFNLGPSALKSPPWALALLPTTPFNLASSTAREGHTTTTSTGRRNSRPCGPILTGPWPKHSHTGYPAPTTITFNLQPHAQRFWGSVPSLVSTNNTSLCSPNCPFLRPGPLFALHFARSHIHPRPF